MTAAPVRAASRSPVPAPTTLPRFDESAGPVILIAGGGSGGHISPGLAVAERLAAPAEGPAIRCLFACSDRAVDAHMLGTAGAACEPLPARPPSVHPRRFVRFALAFRRSRARCRTLLRRHDVRRVLALGGFVAAPAVAAARSLGVPVTLVNLDDPPGRANRWIARRCERVVSAIELPRHPGFAARVVGVPLRTAALAPRAARAAGDGDDARAARAACRARFGLAPDRPTLLVTGASQGALSLNAFLGAFAAADPRRLDGWQILHLAGADRTEPVRAAYEAAGVAACVEPFVDAMGAAWGAASLAISRAGANSVAEAAANAVPTLFLPYPYHHDQHQRHNAAPLVAEEAAVMEEDRIEPDRNLDAVGPVLAALLADADRRRAMRDRLTSRPRPDAAEAIAAELRAAVGGAG